MTETRGRGLGAVADHRRSRWSEAAAATSNAPGHQLGGESRRRQPRGLDPLGGAGAAAELAGAVLAVLALDHG